MKDVLTTLLSITVGSGIIWAAVLLLRKVFQKHLSPTMRMVLWSLFLLRLIIPVSIETGFVLPELAWPSSSAAAVHSTVSASETATVGPAAGRNDSSKLQSIEAFPAKRDVNRTRAPLPSSSEEPKPFPQEALWLTVWLFGAAVSGIAAVLAYQQLISRLEMQCVSSGHDLDELFRKSQRELGVRACVRLAVQRDGCGPALVFPNILVLPEKVLTLPRTDVQMALRHELTHYRRGDQVFSLLLCLLRVVYWFNPFVWLAIRSIRDDLETACDHDVLRRLGSSLRPDYARSVLTMYKNANTPHRILGMASGNGRKHVEERIKGMYLPMKSNCKARIVSLILIGTLGFACFTTGCQPTPEREAVVNQSNSELRQERGTDGSASKLAGGEPFTAPEHVTEEPREISHLTLEVDADVSAPGTSAGEAISATKDIFTEERVADLVELLTGSDGITLLGEYQPTASYWKDLLAQLTESGVRDDAFAEYLASRAQTAPEQERKTPLDYGSLSKTTINEVWAETSDGTIAYLMMGNNQNSFQFTRSQGIVVIPESATMPADKEEDKPGDPTISKEEAVQTASAFAEKAGVQLTFLDAEPALIKDNGIPTETGWTCVFTRSVGELQKQERSGGAYINPDALPSRVSPWGPETLRITVDSHGVVQATWFGASLPGDTLDSAVTLFPFDELQEKVISQLGYIYGPRTKEDGTGMHVTVTGYSLGEEMIAVPESPDTAIYVPAWTVEVEERWADEDEPTVRSYVFTAMEGTYVEPDITTREYLEMTQ